MPGYLLLRNNKESGPFSLEEIIAKQLKPQDLIWVDGRSAAWRYPEELEELKKYVNTPEQVNVNVETVQVIATTKKATEEEVKQVAVAPVAKQETNRPAEKGGKYISVIFPSTPKQVTAEKANVPEKKQPEPYVYPEKTNSINQMFPERIIVEDEHPKAVPNFSTSSFPTKNTVKDKYAVPPNSPTTSFDRVKYGIWGMVILMGGIVLGLSLDNLFRSKTPDPYSKASVEKQSSAKQQNQAEEPGIVNTSSSESSTPISTINTEPLVQEPPVEKIKKKKTSEKSEEIIQKETPKTQPAVETNTGNNAVATKNTAVNEEKEKARANIRNMVFISNNKFKIGAFGGIRELQVSVKNSSPYPLDVVTVDVQYLLANDKVFKTETLYFRDIRPGVTLMQEAPKSPRGVKILYNINNVNSRELGLTQNN